MNDNSAKEMSVRDLETASTNPRNTVRMAINASPLVICAIYSTIQIIISSIVLSSDRVCYACRRYEDVTLEMTITSQERECARFENESKGAYWFTLVVCSCTLFVNLSSCISCMRNLIVEKNKLPVYYGPGPALIVICVILAVDMIALISQLWAGISNFSSFNSCILGKIVLVFGTFGPSAILGIFILSSAVLGTIISFNNNGSPKFLKVIKDSNSCVDWRTFCG